MMIAILEKYKNRQAEYIPVNKFSLYEKMKTCLIGDLGSTCYSPLFNPVHQQ